MPSPVSGQVLFPGFVLPEPWASQGLGRPLRYGRALVKDPELLSLPARRCCFSRRERQVISHWQEAELARAAQGRVMASCSRNKRHPAYHSPPFTACCWCLSSFLSLLPELPRWGNTQELFF